MTKKRPLSNTEKVSNYSDYLDLPLKFAAFSDWFPNPTKEYQIIANNAYLALVVFTLINLAFTLVVHSYTEWVDVMGSLGTVVDGIPLLVSLTIVSYFAANKDKLYGLVEYMNENFKFYSARGLTNMTMRQSYEAAKNFSRLYFVCTMFSVVVYVFMPLVIHVWTKQPMQPWVYEDVTGASFFVVVFLRHILGQSFVGLAFGELGIFYATNAINLCGQYDLLCCSLRNARYTALLHRGVSHAALAASYKDILDDERHSYTYNKSEMVDSEFHYDGKTVQNYPGKVTQFDIYSSEYDEATCNALRECARVSQVAAEFKERFERFVSPMLVLRVVQVTVYLCMLLYAASLKFDMITVEYVGAVALDIFVYTYFGNQIISQADRVSTAAYQSLWPAMGAQPRRLLLNILLANKRPVVVRAWRFLPMDLHTFVVIIKTSFSYYTLLANVNEKK